MTNILSARTDDPFIATTEDPIVRWMAERILRHRANKQKLHETSTRDDDELITEEEWNDLCMAQKLVHDADQSLVTPPIGGTRRDQVEKKQRRSFKVRFLVAAVGGVFLIAPMWLMVLHNTLYTSLVSTSVLVFLFGAVVAWRLDSPKEVLATTAAYAAVLVVFVGTNSSPSETPE
jgi:VIT1/CCC1 family predicted Fe2+/Mn2+ transporter